MKPELIKPIAEHIYDELKPFCEDGFVHIAGSVRRKKANCGDIEIVCYAKRHQISEGLFGDEKKYVKNQEFVDTIRKWHGLSGDPYGRYTKRLYQYGDEFEDVQVDIFMPQKEDYFRQLAIRTGSADYSAYIIAPAWVKLGFRGTEDGLRWQPDCIQKNGKWICVSKHPVLPPAWKSEEEFFQWLKIPYLEPEKRI
jgi:DNA polymerase/3'-5' exonuclease PolX